MEKRGSKRTSIRESIASQKRASSTRFSSSQNVDPPSKSKTCRQNCRKSCCPSPTKTCCKSVHINQCRSPLRDCMNRPSLYQYCCNDNLGVIEENCEREELVNMNCRNVRDSCPCPAEDSEPEEDPCAEFFDAMQDAVKNSIGDMCGRYFAACLGKLDNIAKHLKHTECKMTKYYNDLNDKIAFYGNRNSEQFQYLALRIEHDHLLYQQQQEYFLKSQNRLSRNPMDGTETEQIPNDIRKSEQPQPEIVFPLINNNNDDVKNDNKVPEKSQSEPIVAARRSSLVKNNDGDRASENAQANSLLATKSSEVRMKDKPPEKPQGDPVATAKKSSDAKMKDVQARSVSPGFKTQEQIGDQNKGGVRRRSIEIIEPLKGPSFRN